MRAAKPALQAAQRQLALHLMPELAIPHFLLQRWQQIKGDICGLELSRICVGDVVNQGSERGDAWRRNRRFTSNQRRGMNYGQHAGGDRFDVTFYTANLPREENSGMHLHLLGIEEQGWRVNVGIAVDLAESKEAGVFQAGDQSQDTALLAVPQVILKSAQIVG